MVKAYTEGGWQADAAVLDALAAVSHYQDQEAVCAAIAQVYSPWLRDAAELFQKRVKQQPLPGSRSTPAVGRSSGTCVLFADGLRYDVGQKLKAALEGKRIEIQLRPSVRRTAVGDADRQARRFAGGR